MTSLLSAFREALLHFAWQGLMVFAALWGTLFGLRKRTANARYVASCVALATLFAAPIMTTWSLERQRLTGPPRIPAIERLAPEAATTELRAGSSQSLWLLTLQPWVLPVWALGVIVFSLRMVYGGTQIAVLRRRGREADSAVLSMIATLSRRLILKKHTRVMISAWEGGPSLVGWLRPVILLPASAVTGLTRQQLEAVLAHELAHVRRHDYLVNWFQALVETLLFYHPAVWWVSSRIRHERELCCDDLAVNVCEGPMCYARALTALEKMRATTPVLAVGANGGALLYRIRRIMGVKGDTCDPSRASGIVAVSLMVACLVTGAHWAQGQNRPPQDYLTQGDLLMRAGAYEPALQKYKQGIEEDQAKRATYQKRSIEVLMRIGNKAGAAEVNAQVLMAHPDDTDALAFGATILLEKGEILAAINQLRQVIERVPDNPVAHFNLGQAYEAQHEALAARREIEEALRLRPDFIRARLELALLDPAAQQVPAAPLGAAAGTPADNFDELLALGNEAARMNQYDQAIYHFQRLLDRLDQSSNQRGDVYLRLGEAYRRKGDAVGAIQALQKARELLPDNRLALIALIMALEAGGRHPEALQLRKEAEDIAQTRGALTASFLRDEMAFEEKRLEASTSHFYIHGEVAKPGVYSLLTPTRVLGALVNSGGFRETANSSDVVILHSTGERDSFNYQEVVAGKNLDQNIFLKPGDIIIVK